MQTKKMSLANIQGALSRKELKKIMAGSGGGVYCKQEGTPCGGGGVCISRWADVQCCCSVDPPFGGNHNACKV